MKRGGGYIIAPPAVFPNLPKCPYCTRKDIPRVTRNQKACLDRECRKARQVKRSVP